MQIIFFSENKDKIREVNCILVKIGIIVKARKFKFNELASLELKDIAIDKARQLSRIVNEPFIVDDAGIFFDAYPGFPGTFTKHLFKVLGYDGILKLLKGKSRKAYFRCVIAYNEAKDKILTFEGICRGIISPAIRGGVSGFSPFNRLFIPDGEDKTYAELDIEKQVITSHRAKALHKLARYLTNFQK